MFADTESRCGSFEHRRRSLGGVGLVAPAAALPAAAPCVWGRAAVALVVALAAVCTMVPAAQAQQVLTAFHGSNGNLWTFDPWNPDGGRDLSAGMAKGTSPSINNWGEIAFQADTGSLWTNRDGALNLGMMAGTSPSIDNLCCALSGNGGEIVFQANTGELWEVGGGEACNCSWKLGMMAGTSPSIDPEGSVAGNDNLIAFQANTGHLWNLSTSTNLIDTGQAMAAGTSPSIANDVSASGGVETVAFQGSNGNLWTNSLDNGKFQSTDLHAGMMAGTSPSMNGYGDIAFQANNGHLFVTSDNPTDTGQRMAAGTSPSIADSGTVAYQGSDGQLWQWDGQNAIHLGLEMAPNTSPSVQPGLIILGPPPPTSVDRGGPDDDRLDGGSGHNLIRGGRSNDLIRGGGGHDRGYGGPGNDRSYGGAGNDFLYGGAGNDRIAGGPGKDRIVDHRGATTAFAGSGNNVVDVADGRGDDRVVCTPGTITDLRADRRDRIARSCRQRVPQPPKAR
jgi:Ca2+-binding RTX toxin-like protein